MLGSGLISLLGVVVAAQIPLTAPQQSAIDSFMAARQPEGYGPGEVMTAAAADVTGDQVTDIAAVYAYRIGTYRDRTGTHFIVVLAGEGEGTGYRAIGPWVIGLKGYRWVDSLTIEDGAILLRGRQYLLGDPMCCPAGAFEMELIVQGGSLKELRGTWTRPVP